VLRRALALATVTFACIAPVLADETVALTTESGPDDGTVIREIPRPAPSLLPSPPPGLAAAQTTPAPLVRGGAGTLSFSVDFDGPTRAYRTTLAANAEHLHGSLFAYGTGAFGTPLGSLAIGDARARTSIGSLEDPLAGVVVRNGTFTGIDLHRGWLSGGVDAYVGKRLDGSEVFALERAHGAVTDTAALVSSGGRLGDLLLRHDVMQRTSWGSFEEELLGGTRGAAIGYEARTSGKTFVDATLSRSIGTVPVQSGDLPTSISVGRVVGNNVTVSLGYAEAIDAPARAYVGATAHFGTSSLSLSAARDRESVYLTNSGRNGFVQLFGSFGATPSFGTQGTLRLQELALDFSGSASAGTSAGTAQVHTTRPGFNLAAGVDYTNGTLRPLLGIVAPLTPSFALETALITGTSGHPAVRLSLIAGFRARVPRVTTFPLELAIDSAPIGAPLRLFVDGALRETLRDGRATIALTAGTHDVFVASADGTFGSPQRQVLAGVDRAVTLSLVQQRSIVGRVRFAAAPGEIPAGLSLQGVRLVLDPTGTSVTADPEGGFVFPRAPYPTEARVLVDPATLPAGFAQPAAAAVVFGDEVGIALAPLRAVERARF
jgi:hypothetical protein